MKHSVSDKLPSRQLVLLGVGHTNAHVVRMWGMNPIADTALTCISSDPVATYSGMLPAVLARQIRPEEMRIDLVRLCASVGARLITDPVTAVDANNRRICFENRPDIPFDILSIGIGSVPNLSGVEIRSNRVLAIKPMQSFLQRLTQSTKQALQELNGEKLRIAIIGSGVAGVEISFCLRGFLKELTTSPYSIQIISRSNQVLPEVTPGTRRRVEREFQQQGIELTVHSKVVSVNDRLIRLNTGREIEADIIIWATGATAPDLLKTINLDKDDRGFVLTDNSLRCISRRPIFAVGDSGTIQQETLPKAGVYAVRQGPVLWNNLQRLSESKPLETYSPQKSFLKLLNTGDGSAIGQFKGMSFSGGWVRQLKDRIDNTFMQKYIVSDKMAESMPIMDCKGCGCKVGSDLLNGVISPFVEFEDAARIQVGGTDVLASTDFFTPPFDDAFLNGRVAAIHAASDIIAMGAKAAAALAIVVLPEAAVATQQQLFRDLMQGAKQEFQSLGIDVVGGHTITGPRLEIGFTVIGQPADHSFTKGGLQPGDQLLLTKPLGTGILLAGHMRSLCRHDEYSLLVETMLESQADIASLAMQLGARAATDVTGFGLAGHLVEMLQASNVSATIDLAALPLLPGTARLLAQGVHSTLAPANRSVRPHFQVEIDDEHQQSLEAMFDPQTCGGLLIGLPQDAAAELIRQSRRSISVVGHVTERGDFLAHCIHIAQEKSATVL